MAPYTRKKAGSTSEVGADPEPNLQKSCRARRITDERMPFRTEVTRMSIESLGVEVETEEEEETHNGGGESLT